MFHRDVPLDFVMRVFKVMNECPQHTFQILTKRSARLAALGRDLPWRSHVWQGVSVESSRYTSRILQLQQVPAAVRFLSIEPLLGPIPRLPLAGIHWVTLLRWISAGGHIHRPEILIRGE